MTTSAEPVDPRELGELLEAPAARFGVDLAPVLAPLARYAGSLLHWNQRINLTGARDLPTLAREHLADALALAPLLPAAGRWIDVGSGGGLPGIVLAILRRDLEAVLLEPIQKRRVFLASMARELALERVTVVGDRLETHLEAGGRHAYALAIARAVFPLAEWLELGRSLVTPGVGVVVGLEGSERGSLPTGAERIPYESPSGVRAVIRVRP